MEDGRTLVERGGGEGTTGGWKQSRERGEEAAAAAAAELSSNSSRKREGEGVEKRWRWKTRPSFFSVRLPAARSGARCESQVFLPNIRRALKLRRVIQKFLSATTSKHYLTNRATNHFAKKSLQPDRSAVNWGERASPSRGAAVVVM